MGLFSQIKNWIIKPPPQPDLSLCCICQEPLVGETIQDTWKNLAHLTHRIGFCSSCERILSPHGSSGGFQYSDGRLICGLCKKMAILDDVSANQSRRKVLGQLENVGFLGIPKNIKITLAHPQILSAHSRKSHTSGLTLSHFHFSDYKRVGITHQIGILYGLPKIEFEAVMAHEFLHVWQQENNIRFSLLYAEGLCELGGFLVYSEENSDLAKHLLQKMKNSKDPVYGNGFRLMQKKLEALGWEGLIQEVLRNKQGFESSVLKKIFGK
jgi:hypothetical protein